LAIPTSGLAEEGKDHETASADLDASAVYTLAKRIDQNVCTMLPDDREASRRYQGSERGRQCHRHRQHRYRHRQTRVTHQGGRMIALSPPPRRSVVSRCTICGRVSSRYRGPNENFVLVA